MNCITRFSPSTNGGLHLGHIYSLLVNEQFAHTQEGKFIVRFDNTTQHVMEIPEDIRNRITEQQRKDIEWLQVPVDVWQYQSDILEMVQVELKKYNFPVFKEPEQGWYQLPYFVRIGYAQEPIPYLGTQTPERVIMDNMIGATHIIRGEEFASEYSYYCFICEYLGFPIPKFIFLPRLLSIKGDISKTAGGYKISEMRSAGYSPEQIKELLIDACLIYPSNGWNIYNLKSAPRINI